MAEWKSIGVIDPNFGLSGSGLVEWHLSGRMAVHWMASDSSVAQNLAKIEASDWSGAQNPAL